ncbi:MAG: Gfo/Idh/MocA family oxidoreductase [Planctomycetaceae bacterium]|jgi:predicted dehydrogenase|nr:Gfo/Idh/MocA family oxidoreductase [Planctomycetaceae bacterium]MBT6484515.1 Gfo/Idh/MocA family oxidoreductase [Planctomycetaceae bacterium]
MAEAISGSTSRREFLKNSGKIAGAAALVGSAATHVHAGENNTISIALVGCGGRGTGAASNALSVKNGPIKLVAMADVFEDRLATSHRALSNKFKEKVEVGDAQKLIGFDAYKDAMDLLKPGDVVILTTPPAFRWVQYTYAIQKGLNVFMEKPVTVDGPSTRKMLALNVEAKKKNLKVGVGLMCRHCLARKELFERIQDGEIGDVLELRAYRNAGPTGSAAVGPKPDGMSELEYQIRHFHGFLWASGGAVSDFLIHNLDESCWMKNDWPVEVEGSGGRHYRGDNVDQNFDNYNMEYTFGDGTKLFLRGRTIPGCYNKFASYVVGSKGSAIISTASHAPARSRIFKGYNFTKEEMVWAYPQPEPSPYQLEWDDLIQAIRQDQPYNEVDRGAEASLMVSMGRMASHTGQLITRDTILNSEHEFAPGVADLTLDGDAPLQVGPNGKYPVPLPGLVKKREY